MCDTIATRLDSVLCTCKSLRESGAAYGLASEAKPNRVIVAFSSVGGFSYWNAELHCYM